MLEPWEQYQQQVFCYPTHKFIRERVNSVEEYRECYALDSL